MIDNIITITVVIIICSIIVIIIIIIIIISSSSSIVLKKYIVKLGMILTKVLTFVIVLTLFLMSLSVTSMAGQFSLVDGKGYFPAQVTQGCSFC